MFKKNDEIEVNIIDYGTDGEGVAKADNFTIFVSGGIKGEKCKIIITKILKNYGYGKIIEIIEKSNKRAEIDCKTYPRCGGCSLRHVEYQETLNIKKEKVQNLINKNVNESLEVNDCIGMENPFYYRNKAIFPISTEKGVPGIYAKRSHIVIPFEECKIQTKISQEIARFICENWKSTIYNENKNTRCP